MKYVMTTDVVCLFRVYLIIIKLLQHIIYLL